MTTKEIIELFEYSDRANDKFVQMISNAFGEETDLTKCDDERVIKIQNIAVHIFAGNVIWRKRMEGEFPNTTLQSCDYPTPLSIKFGIGAERARFCSFLESIQNDENLDESVHYLNMVGESYHLHLKQILMHLFTHAMYHRGQISSLLMELGYSGLIESTDISGFYLEKQSR